MIRVPGRRRPRNLTGSDATFWYVAGVLVTLGLVAGFVLPFGDRVASVMKVNLHWMGAALGALAGLALAAMAEWLWLTVGRGVQWVWFRMGFGPAPAAAPDLASRTSPLVDNLSRDGSTGARLDRAMINAQRLDICTSYVSRAGLERLATWLDQMDRDARVRLLIGMAADGWRDWGKGELTTKAAPFFLAQHFRPNQQYDQAAVPFLERLARHQADGRLEVRLRHPRAALHAKLFIWTDADDRQESLIGSSNLTAPGLGGRGELNAHMRKSDSTRYFVAWFDTRWQEKDSVGDPKLLEHTRQTVARNRADRHG